MPPALTDDERELVELVQRIHGAGPIIDAERADEAKAGLERVHGGYCVKQLVEGEGCAVAIDVMKMLYNWRLVLAFVDENGDRWPVRSWCYFGHGNDADGNPRSMRTAFATAVAAATAWDGRGDTEPELYDKAVGS